MRLKQTIHQMLEQRIVHPQWKLSDFSITTTPQLTVSSTAHGYQITARLPGIQPEQITATIQEHHVILQTIRSEETESEGKGPWHIHESRNSSYECAITFVRAVDAARAIRHYARGTLTLTLPLNEDNHPT